MTRKMTITEALAEIKVIEKRVAKKREFVNSYFGRQQIVRDPFEAKGGSAVLVPAEQQAIADLLEERIRIRGAIQMANYSNTITIGRVTRSIGAWLTWRREVAPTEQQLVADLRARIDGARKNATQRGGSVVPVGAPATGEKSDESNLVLNVDEKRLTERAEEIESSLATLDGLLSLKNATIVIGF